MADPETSERWLLYGVTGRVTDGVTGGGTVRLSQPNMSAVQRGFSVPGDLVRFAQDPSGSGIATWYAAPVVGGAVWTEIMFEDFERGTKGGFR